MQACGEHSGNTCQTSASKTYSYVVLTYQITEVACDSVCLYPYLKPLLTGFIGEIQAVTICVGSLSKLDLLIQDVAPHKQVLCQLSSVSF